MGRTDFSRMRCPVARAMEVLGERWAVLVLREAYYGTTRFDDFERRLGIAPNILSARLKKLVGHGVLARSRPVQGDARRVDYRLTEKGRDFFPAYVAIKQWGDRWMNDPDGKLVILTERATGIEIGPGPVLGAAGNRLQPEDIRVLPGPGATSRIRARFGDLDPLHPDVEDTDGHE